ncbi:MAG: hypothetical protein ACR2RA_19395, partial [Geminicoccaceae bacterium]
RPSARPAADSPPVSTTRTKTCIAARLSIAPSFRFLEKSLPSFSSYHTEGSDVNFETGAWVQDTHAADRRGSAMLDRPYRIGLLGSSEVLVAECWQSQVLMTKSHPMAEDSEIDGASGSRDYSKIADPAMKEDVMARFNEDRRSTGFARAIAAALTFVLAGLSVTGDASAQSMRCVAHDKMVERLGAQLAEAPVSIGLGSDGKLLELFTTDDGATWTLVQTMPQGFSCIVAAGRFWHSRTPNADDPTA